MTPDEYQGFLTQFLAELPEALLPILNQLPEAPRFELAQLLNTVQRPFPGGAGERAHGHAHAAFLRNEISHDELATLEAFIYEKTSKNSDQGERYA